MSEISRELERISLEMPIYHKAGRCYMNVDTLLYSLLLNEQKGLYDKVQTQTHYSLLEEWIANGENTYLLKNFFQSLIKVTAVH